MSTLRVHKLALNMGVKKPSLLYKIRELKSVQSVEYEKPRGEIIKIKNMRDYIKSLPK